MLDAVAWADAEDLVRELIGQILAPYGVGAEVTYVRGVPPVVNEPGRHGPARQRRAVRCSGSGGRSPRRRASAGRTSRGTSRTSPGRWAGSAPGRRAGATYDLHQGDLHVDERADRGRCEGPRGRRRHHARRLGSAPRDVRDPPRGVRNLRLATEQVTTSRGRLGRGPGPGSGVRVCPGLRLDRWRTKQGGILRRLTKIAAVTAVMALAVTGCAKKDTETNTASGGDKGGLCAAGGSAPRSGSPTTSAGGATSRSTTWPRPAPRRPAKSSTRPARSPRRLRTSRTPPRRSVSAPSPTRATTRSSRSASSTPRW